MKKLSRMKKLLPAICMLFFLAVICPAQVSAADDDVIYNDETGMPDPVLYKAVLKVLGRAEGTFTKKEAAGITELWTNSYPKQGVKTLKGIEYFTGLERLGFSYDEIATLAGIEGLTKLKELHAENCKLKNLEGIEELTGLEILCIQGNELKYINSVKNLTNLKYLEAGHNEIISLKGVHRLKNLEHLGAGGNHLEDPFGGTGRIGKLSILKKLTSLDLSENELTEIPSLAKMENLDWKETSFMGNKLSAEEIIKKSPAHLVMTDEWLERQIKSQDVHEKLQCKTPKSFKKITANTKNIIGKARKSVTVRLMSGKKTIQKTKADKKGVFRFKKLDLKKFKGKKLKLQVYCHKQISLYNRKYEITWVSKEVSFKLKKG